MKEKESEGIELMIFCSSLAGATTTAAIYQAVITGNLIWLLLLALNVLFFAGCLYKGF